MPRTVRFIATTAISVVLLVDQAQAQRWRASLTPFVGAYVPTKDLGRITVNISGANTSVDATMRAGPVFGAKLNLTNRGRLGIEANYFYANSKTRITLGILGREEDGNVQGGSLRATYRVTDRRTDTDLYLSAGVGGQKHSGTLLRLTQDAFDIGGVFGAGLHLTLSPQVVLRIDGDANIYSWSPARSLASAGQLDFLLIAGLALRLGR